MNKIFNLLAKLESDGIFIALDGEALRVESKNGPIDADIRQTLKFEKFEIIRVLKEKQPKPYLTSACNLVIPFESDPRYHWWKPGSLRSWEIRDELMKRMVN